jgi:hypothetical protein
MVHRTYKSASHEAAVRKPSATNPKGECEMFNFDDANKVSKEAVDTVLKSYSAMANGMQTIAAEAADYSKKSFEQGASTVEKLSGAKSMEKVLEIQTEFAKSSYESFVQQAAKMGEIYADLAKEAYRPFERSVNKSVN